MSSFMYSISSTLMDLESSASSGRSTPAMLNGHGGSALVGSSTAATGGKSLNYTCCWDLCQLQFLSSPDLAEHIRATHVDGQRGGVSVFLHIFFGMFKIQHKVISTARILGGQRGIHGHMLHLKTVSQGLCVDSVCIYTGVCVSVEGL